MYNVYKTKNAFATVEKDGKIIGYLTKKHEELGYDIELDMLGYTINAI